MLPGAQSQDRIMGGKKGMKQAGKEWNRESEAYGWYVVAILLMAGITSYLDRNVLFLLVEPIRETMGLSDTQISLLEGIAFSFFFLTMGMPLGAVIDRWNRRNMIIIGVAIWSVMTFCCGLARNYEELFLARMGVGFGEAILGPAAYSMIADYFAPTRRARAASVYNLSNFLGGAMASIGGGAIIHITGTLAIIPLPVLGNTIAWKTVFFAAALPGILVVLLMFTVREPVRQETSGSEEPRPAFLPHLRRHARAYAFVYASYVLMTFVGLSSAAWSPTYLQRSFDVTPAQSGQLLGASALLAIFGTLASGWLSDRFAASGAAGGRFRTALVGFPLMLLGLAIFLGSPLLWLALAGSGLAAVGGAIILVSCPPVLQDITPNRLRGRAQALFYVLSVTMGMGVAPTAVALVTDYVFQDTSMLRYSLIVVQIPAAIAGAIVCLIGQRSYETARVLVADTTSFEPEPEKRESS